jgi:hypothetical protein
MRRRQVARNGADEAQLLDPSQRALDERLIFALGLQPLEQVKEIAVKRRRQIALSGIADSSACPCA